ncbi:hypothetical protein MMC08_000408 [Hypocenomyce scalaris]|nr:hypothetical protein [Hypocenomyce scalaris]
MLVRIVLLSVIVHPVAGWWFWAAPHDPDLPTIALPEPPPTTHDTILAWLTQLEQHADALRASARATLASRDQLANLIAGCTRAKKDYQAQQLKLSSMLETLRKPADTPLSGLPSGRSVAQIKKFSEERLRNFEALHTKYANEKHRLELRLHDIEVQLSDTYKACQPHDIAMKVPQMKLRAVKHELARIQKIKQEYEAKLAGLKFQYHQYHDELNQHHDEL